MHTIDNLNHWVRALIIKNSKLYAGIYQAIQIFDINTFDVERIIDINGIGGFYRTLVAFQFSFNVNKGVAKIAKFVDTLVLMIMQN